MRRILPVIFILTVALAGCASEPEVKGPSQDSLKALSEEARTVQVQLPEFVREAPPRAQEAYSLAYAHTYLLTDMPCYCGCGSSGHEHNAHCFIQDKDKDGNVQWDRMGAT
ncbi:hypothetical protein GCM10007416_27530 [Kroppenstedtia guangzhouensis]|uniref:Lipoprotein n=1 Tax=Kroppenstedtia guangzhouensis TaxID=1274356 RepID=A0ABQ1H093_9BACL|nr:hypothetical protein GCM10007416_27530 [Kroppenstedtia guangzhouensis]